MLYSSHFLSLDGVMSDPHVWYAPYASPESVGLLAEQLDTAAGLLVGRRTYEELAGWWPAQDDSVPLARRTNAIAKHVVSSGLDHVDWTNSSIVEGDVVTAVEELTRDQDVMLPGSATLLNSLLRAELVDELRIYLAPIVVGHGRRLFDHDAPPAALELVDRRPLPHGVHYLAYRPTEGAGA